MRFNTESLEPTKTTNLAGGEAFQESPELELVSILLTSFLGKQHYRRGEATLKRVAQLMDQVEPMFAAKAAIFARTEFGMRSVSHVVAGELLKRVKGQPWMKDFLNAVIYRPDDMLEICAYYDTKKNGPTHALRKGLAAAISRFDEYQLAKYRGEGKAYSLVDIANIAHAKETAAIRALVRGKLRSVRTWETKLTQAGQAVQEIEDEKEKEEKALKLKTDVWRDMIENGKLGYFALLRNVRNLIEQADDSTFTMAMTQLVDPSLIKRSLVLPFRFITAAQALSGVQGTRAKRAINSINSAVEVSLGNVPKLEGRTVIALDDSGSMQGKLFAIGALFAAALVKSTDADLLLFNSQARFLQLVSADSLLGLSAQIRSAFKGGSTDFKPIFGELVRGKVAYDRIIILSDMQGWVGHRAPTKGLQIYREIVGANPHVYSIDLAGYGTLQFPERQVYALAGLSDKLFELMGQLEQDRNILLNKIRAVKFEPRRLRKGRE